MRAARTVAMTGLALFTLLATSAAAAGQDPEVEARPTFTPYTLKPELKNAEEVRRQLTESYPPLLRQAGIAGAATYWLLIDRTGEVRKVELFRSSGYEALDAAGSRVALSMRFSPAQNRDRPVDVWVQIPVNFVAGGAERAEARRPEQRRVMPRDRPTGEGTPSRRVTRAELMAAPTFTPYTEKPILANQAATRRALQRSYPPMLRDAGIGGTTTVWFLIDEEGGVLERRVARTSGYEALDVAALDVAEAMEFSPALNRGRAVPVWVQIPVSFSSK
jgi:TonB family protein